MLLNTPNVIRQPHSAMQNNASGADSMPSPSACHVRRSMSSMVGMGAPVARLGIDSSW